MLDYIHTHTSIYELFSFFRLKLLAEQYQAREKHLEKLNEQVQLESQLHQAKLNKAKVEAAMEKDILTKWVTTINSCSAIPQCIQFHCRENQIGLEKLLQAQRAIRDLTDREQQLKEQLNIYTAKYDEFQKSLQKSNEVFGSYKVELEKMSKHTKKIEKEALGWRQKYEKANATVIELATEKQARDQQSERLQKQVDQLQKLLRALQQERFILHQTLRDKKIDIPALPQLPPEPEPVKVKQINSDNTKMEMMTRNCAELKQTLANLQNQMKLLTTNDAKIAAAEAEKCKAQAEQELLQQQRAKKNNKKKEKKSKAKAAAAAAAAAAAETTSIASETAGPIETTIEDDKNDGNENEVQQPPPSVESTEDITESKSPDTLTNEAD